MMKMARLAATTAALVGAMAAPAAALPMIDVGANLSGGAHFAGGGTAATARAEVNVFGNVADVNGWFPVQGGPLGGTSNYVSATLRRNLSPIPFINVAPGLGAVVLNGQPGFTGMIHGRISPFILPISLHSEVGVAAVGGQTLIPYQVGAKLHMLIFGLGLHYRGWGGSGAMAGLGGPAITLEAGI